MTEAIPSAIALTLEEHLLALAQTRNRLDRLRLHLEAGDEHAADHAEEQIEWAVDALRGTASRLDYLKRYTRTGAARIGWKD